jgi:hypothetical protein
MFVKRPSAVRLGSEYIVSLTLPAVIGPVDELLGGTPDPVWQRALTVHARFAQNLPEADAQCITSCDSHRLRLPRFRLRLIADVLRTICAAGGPMPSSKPIDELLDARVNCRPATASPDTIASQEGRTTR